LLGPALHCCVPVSQQFEAHSKLAPHPSPSARRWHTLPVQMLLAQSLLPLHEVGQATLEPLQANGKQVGEPAALAGRGEQVPGTTLQASHAPVQAVSQHTPSTQLPVPHSSPLKQPTPGVSFKVHSPLTQ
jgi:hypothetical protein